MMPDVLYRQRSTLSHRRSLVTTKKFVTTKHVRVQNELVSTLYKEDLTGELMRETDDVAERRRISRDMVTLLEKAVNIVSEVRDFNPFLG